MGNSTFDAISGDYYSVIILTTTTKWRWSVPILCVYCAAGVINGDYYSVIILTTTTARRAINVKFSIILGDTTPTRRRRRGRRRAITTTYGR
jgi:hypothetical protein